MQNLALSSQFNNSGRRGSSSSNSFQSLVMNGVLPPSEDGKVEAIGMHNPSKKKKWVYRDDSPLEPGGWMEIDDNNPFDAEHGGGGLGDGTGPGHGSGWGTGKGLGGDSGVPGYDVAYGGNFGGSLFPKDQGYIYPTDEVAEEIARQRRLQRVIGNFLNHFGNKQFVIDFESFLKEKFISDLYRIGANENDNFTGFSLLTNVLYEAIRHPFTNVINAMEDFLRKGDFSAEPPKSFTINVITFNKDSGSLINTAHGKIIYMAVSVSFVKINGLIIMQLRVTLKTTTGKIYSWILTEKVLD
jgi:hypothetical protein